MWLGLKSVAAASRAAARDALSYGADLLAMPGAQTRMSGPVMIGTMEHCNSDDTSQLPVSMTTRGCSRSSPRHRSGLADGGIRERGKVKTCGSARHATC